MNDSMVGYFLAEKHESALFVIIGLAAAALSIWLWRSPHRGMVYPLVAIALIQIAVGGSVYLRTDAQIASLSAQFKNEPEGFVAAETARMNVVVTNFKIYKSIEIALLVAGIVMSFVVGRREPWLSLAAGLIIQSAIMLTLDLFAEQRAALYQDEVAAHSRQGHE